MFCGMPIGTCQAEAPPNSEKIKPVALGAIKLRLSKGISKSVSESKFTLNIIFLNFVATYWKRSGSQ